MANWDHDTHYFTLSRRGLEHTHKKTGKPIKNPYVYLYAGQNDEGGTAAILYKRGGSYDAAPIHMNSKKDGWREDIFDELRSVLVPCPVHPDPNGYSHYLLAEGGWDVIAKVLGLE
jgi:hypothetical protein